MRPIGLRCVLASCGKFYFLVRPIQIPLILAVVMLATRMGGVFGFPPSGISTFWPPNAILFASILLLEKYHRAICLLLAFPTYVVAELWIGFDLAASLVFAAVNCIAVGLAIGVVRRLGLTRADLSDLRQLGVLLVAVTAASVLGGDSVRVGLPIQAVRSCQRRCDGRWLISSVIWCLPLSF